MIGELRLRFLGAVALMACFAPSAAAEYNSRNKRDPFVPLLTSDGQRLRPPGFDEQEAAGISGLSLQGIVFEPGADSYAIINGQLVKEQESVDNARIVKIRSDSVTVLLDGETHQLTVSNPTEENETKS